ncbi:MAG: acetyl-CoA carboxylase biotin carboxyl carrier protein [Bacillota bacterium]|nr:acetyl-CoA carboxylase biotin carboxyl carrier protein [Bacillota bacterium]
MDFNSIEQLIKAVSDSKLTLFDIESDGLKIKMEKKVEQIVVENADKAPTILKSDLLQQQSSLEQQIYDLSENHEEQVVASVTKAEEETSDEFIVKSPIVGTFYSAPSVDAEAFIKIGSKVKKGDVICIIEAMKLMNEIESEVDGEITQIFAENEQMVEYGQQLFKIKL